MPVKIHRTLILAGDHSGFMSGPDVELLQRGLRRIPAFSSLRVDGEYGPATAAAVAAWKRYHAGYPERMLKGGLAQNIGVDGQRIVAGLKKAPAAWLVVAKARRVALARAQAAAVTMGDRALDYARRFLGETESPAGSNRVPRLQREAQAKGVLPWIAAMGYPWCAFFGHLAYLAVGSKAGADGLKRYLFNALYTVTILGLALDGRFGMRVVGWSQAQPGDVGLLNFPGGDPRVDHYVLIERVTGDTAYTVEGNTSSGSAGSQSDGGGVFRRTRPRSQFRAVIRMSNTY